MIDAALMRPLVALPPLLSWLGARRGQRAGAGRTTLTLVPVVRQAATLLGERYGTPGERLVGLRTVDERTGAPVPLAHTTALTALRVGGRFLSKRLNRMGAPSEGDVEASRAQLRSELKAAEAELGEDEDALNRERMRLHEEHRVRVPSPGTNLARSVLAALCLAQLHKRLRRRYAPTIVVVWPPR